MSCCGQPGKHSGRTGMFSPINQNSKTSIDPMQTSQTYDRKKTPAFCFPKKRRQPKGCGVDIGNDQQVDYPDPAIYSQHDQLLLGNIPSWDNPDILTNNWSPFRLMDEAQVTVRNLSATTSAANTLIHFYTSPFGIGTQRTLIASKLIGLAAGGQAILNFPLPQSVLAGDQRVGVHIRIEHPTDNNYQNNEGSQVHDGSYTSETGRIFNVPIPVLNNSAFNRQILLSIMPTDLVATITNASHHFAPYEQIIAQLHIEVPAFLIGSAGAIINRAVTVVGRLPGGELVGGATKLLRINN